MDCNITKNNIYLCKTAFDGFMEEKVDFDIIIPDYCAAAVRILKCDVRPAVVSKSIDGDKLTVNGTCTANVIYIDEDAGLIKSISETVDFSQTQTLKQELLNNRIKLKLRVTNTTCRLQNSRRISIKALLGIAVKVMGNDMYEIITGFDNCDIEAMFDEAKSCVYINSNESDIRISGESETDGDINEIIKCDADILINDIKVINDKVIIKGDATATCLFTTGDRISDVDSIQTVIPFSEIIDVEGADESSICNVECDVIAIRCDIGTSGENGVISFDIDAKALASVYDNVELKLLKDMYSKEHDVDVKTKDITIESLSENMSFTDIIRDTVQLDQDDAVITEITAKPFIKNISTRDDMIVTDGDIIMTLYTHNNNEYRIIDKTIPFSISKEIPHLLKQMRCEANAYVKNISFTIANDTSADVKIELLLNILIFARDTYNVIDDIEISEESALDKFGSKVVLYYADEGESLWNIAKKYYTSVDILKRDNDIDNDRIDSDRMILISKN